MRSRSGRGVVARLKQVYGDGVVLEIVGVLIIFAILFGIVFAMAQGVVRWIGLAIVTLFAIVVGSQTIRGGLPELSNFFGQRSDQPTQSAPANAPNSTTPGNRNTNSTAGQRQAPNSTNVNVNQAPGTSSGTNTGNTTPRTSNYSPANQPPRQGTSALW